MARTKEKKARSEDATNAGAGTDGVTNTTTDQAGANGSGDGPNGVAVTDEDLLAVGDQEGDFEPEGFTNQPAGTSQGDSGDDDHGVFVVEILGHAKRDHIPGGTFDDSFGNTPGGKANLQAFIQECQNIVQFDKAFTAEIDKWDQEREALKAKAKLALQPFQEQVGGYREAFDNGIEQLTNMPLNELPPADHEVWSNIMDVACTFWCKNGWPLHLTRFLGGVLSADQIYEHVKSKGWNVKVCDCGERHLLQVAPAEKIKEMDGDGIHMISIGSPLPIDILRAMGLIDY